MIRQTKVHQQRLFVSVHIVLCFVCHSCRKLHQRECNLGEKIARKQENRMRRTVASASFPHIALSPCDYFIIVITYFYSSPAITTTKQFQSFKNKFCTVFLHGFYCIQYLLIPEVGLERRLGETSVCTLSPSPSRILPNSKTVIQTSSPLLEVQMWIGRNFYWLLAVSFSHFYRACIRYWLSLTSVRFN